ncbi:MAG: DUF393 domain-containing protein [Phycisphaerales bacterium]|nr:DUF393 domain-containing protein [Phycisphaerales bacterium]
MARPRPIIGTVLYDGACGFCRAWVPRWAGVLRRRGLIIDTLQSARDSLGRGVEPADWFSDLRIVLHDATHIRGADAYRFALRRIWWGFPLYLLAVTPGLRRLFDRGYRAFANHRFGVSRVCGLSAREQPAVETASPGSSPAGPEIPGTAERADARPPQAAGRS